MNTLARYMRENAQLIFPFTSGSFNLVTKNIHAVMFALVQIYSLRET